MDKVLTATLKIVDEASPVLDKVARKAEMTAAKVAAAMMAAGSIVGLGRKPDTTKAVTGIVEKKALVLPEPARLSGAANYAAEAYGMQPMEAVPIPGRADTSQEKTGNGLGYETVQALANTLARQATMTEGSAQRISWALKKLDICELEYVEGMRARAELVRSTADLIDSECEVGFEQGRLGIEGLRVADEPKQGDVGAGRVQSEAAGDFAACENGPANIAGNYGWAEENYSVKRQVDYVADASTFEGWGDVSIEGVLPRKIVTRAEEEVAELSERVRFGLLTGLEQSFGDAEGAAVSAIGGLNLSPEAANAAHATMNAYAGAVISSRSLVVRAFESIRSLVVKLLNRPYNISPTVNVESGGGVDSVSKTSGGLPLPSDITSVKDGGVPAAGERVITLNINGSGSILVSGKASGGEIWAAVQPRIRSEVISILETEIAEEGDANYVF